MIKWVTIGLASVLFSPLFKISTTNNVEEKQKTGRAPATETLMNYKRETIT